MRSRQLQILNLAAKLVHKTLAAWNNTKLLYIYLIQAIKNNLSEGRKGIKGDHVE